MYVTNCDTFRQVVQDAPEETKEELEARKRRSVKAYLVRCGFSPGRGLGRVVHSRVLGMQLHCICAVCVSQHQCAAHPIQLIHRLRAVRLGAFSCRCGWQPRLATPHLQNHVLYGCPP